MSCHDVVVVVVVVAHLLQDEAAVSQHFRIIKTCLIDGLLQALTKDNNNLCVTKILGHPAAP